MVESRNKERLQDNCGFCGNHKDDVPLMVTSQLDSYNNPAICANCAMAIVQQTFIRFGILDKQIRQQMRKPPVPELIVPGAANDAADRAINAVQGEHGDRADE